MSRASVMWSPAADLADELIEAGAGPHRHEELGLGAVVAAGPDGSGLVLVEGRRVTDPKVVAWMTAYQRRVLRRLRYDERKGCGRTDLCPAFSLPDLFTTKASYATRKRVEGLLDAVPPYFSQNVISPDRRTATLAFGIRLMPLERQLAVMRTMERELDPPAGVQARLAGLQVLAA